MQKILIAIQILLLGIFLTACNNQPQVSVNEKKADTSTIEIEKIPNKLKKQLNQNLAVDATIEAPITLPNSVKQISAKIKNINNKEKIIKIIFGDEIATNTISQTAKDREGKVIKSEHYKSLDGKNLIWYGKMLNFSTELGYDIDEAFIPSENGDKYFAKDLSFLSQEQALKKAKDFLSLLDISVEKNVQIYALDYQTMKQEQIKTYETLKKQDDKITSSKLRPVRNWTSNDDCYMFQFKQEYNGISISNENFGDSRAKTETYGPIIRLIYGEHGFISGSVGNIYEELDNTEANHTPISLSSAINILQSKFDEIILNNPITINKIEFSYVPKLVAVNKEKYILTPCWIFHASQYSEDIESELDTRIIIDAITGKEIN